LNYLAHYYCDHPQERPEYVLGLILPDLLRETTSGKKIHLHPDKLPEDGGEDMRALNQGILRHLEVDLFFHNSAWFHEQCRETKALFDARPLNSIPNRIWIFAHILVELLMDRVIINRNPELLDIFYGLLDRVDQKMVHRYFADSELGIDPEFAIRRMRHFLDDRYLYRYPDNEMMLFALNVLNNIVGNPVISAEDIPPLIECIELTEQRLADDNLSIFEQLKTRNA
jgi:hypothetical protein